MATTGLKVCPVSGDPCSTDCTSCEPPHLVGDVIHVPLRQTLEYIEALERAVRHVCYASYEEVDGKIKLRRLSVELPGMWEAVRLQMEAA